MLLSRTAVAGFLIAFSAAVLCGQRSASSARQALRLPDKVWWSAASDAARRSFLDGLEDCEEWDALRRPPASPFPTDAALIRSITRYYQQHGTNVAVIDAVNEVTRTEAVRRIAHGLPAAPTPKDRNPGDEVWTNRHWYFDGLWWGQLRPDQQQGYVSGYVSCYVREGPQDRRVIDSVSTLTRLVDLYYQTHPGSDERKAADILLSVGASKSKHQD